MQFRTKFGPSGWLAIVMAPAYFAIWFFKSTHPAFEFYFAICWVALALLNALKARFYFWEMDSLCLRRCWLWGKTEIPWQAVTSVQKTEPIESLKGRLIIFYKDPDPMTYRTNVVVQAEDRPAFLDALQRFASQAKLEA